MRIHRLCGKTLLFAAAVTIGFTAWCGSTVEPVPRPDQWWQDRHEQKMNEVQQGDVELLFIGDSITHGWEGAGQAVWQEYYGDRKAFNIGYSGDRTEHVLWRLDHAEVDGISPKLAVMMIGTNNCGGNTGQEIFEGVQAIVEKLQAKLPDTRLLLLAVFPRRDVPQELQDRNTAANTLMAGLADQEKVFYLDIGPDFLNADGELTRDIMPDLLHPNAAGYRIWADAIEPVVARLLGEVAEGRAPKGYVSIFNGKDLSGWKGLVENPKVRATMSEEEMAKAQEEADEVMRAHWKVENNALVFDGLGSHLCMKRDTEDFEMLVDWKIEAGGDSGIYLRGSPQVQIWDPAQWPQGSGGLYNNQKNPSDPPVCADNKIGEWNHFRIRMIGDEVTVWLNDQLVVDHVTMENYWERDKAMYPSGQIELQSHGSTLNFRNLYLREIPRGEGWKDLFNGKDLSGWEQVGGEKSCWNVEDGVLFTGGGEGGGWLSTVDEYSDYELEVEFKVPEGGNSGIFNRTPRDGNPAYAGFEVQILDDDTEVFGALQDWQMCGSVYSVAAPSHRATLKANDWQKMRVRCEGSQVNVTLNAEPIIDVDLSTAESHVAEHPGLKRAGGFIGLQNHGSRLDFRNIRIRELNAK